MGYAAIAERESPTETPAVEINYNCGCGFWTHSFEEAYNHALVKHHTMSILGRVIAVKFNKPW